LISDYQSAPQLETRRASKRPPAARTMPALTRVVRRPGVNRAINPTFAVLLVASGTFAFLV
jgi:hypothetical protein